MASGLRVWLNHTRDRLVGSDPGLTRLRQAFSAAFAMITALGVEYAFAQLQGGGKAALIPMILGAVLGLMGAMALSGGGPLAKAKTAVWFPVVLGAGLLLGTLVAAHIAVMLGVFVLVMFVAVFVRRFGPNFFFYGFMFWMGYFFASFLHATVKMLPWLLADAAVATVWVFLLSVTVLRTNTRRTLNRTLRAFGARVRAVAAVCAELDDVGERDLDRWTRKLQARQRRLAETGLVIEAWSAEPGALPPGWSAVALRRHLVNLQLSVEELVTATKALVGADPRVTAAMAAIAGQLAGHEYDEADAAARNVLSRLAKSGERVAGAWWAARHFATAVTEYVGVTRRFGQVRTAGTYSEFEPVVSLVMGGVLPGSAAAASDVLPRGRWGLLARLDLPTRQAFQVALAGGLAILAGRALSDTRYYWAVLAAFVAFAGTATRSETFVKATNRVLGTLVGLGAGIGMAHVTAGHTGWVIVTITVSLFCGLYLIQFSYAYMIFFITIMVSQLYSVLNEFSSELLVLRLAETAIGAAIGIVVALTFAPLSTRDVVGTVQRELLTDLAAVLTAASEGLQERPTDDLDTLARALDDRLRQLHLVSAPLTRPLLWGNDPRLARHRLTLCSSLVHYGRRLATTLRQPSPGLAGASLALADTATALAEVLGPPGKRHTPVEELRERLADADAALFTGADSDHLAHRPLTHLWQLLSELVAAAPVELPEPKPAATGAALHGVVRGESGAPLPDATVTLVDTTGRQLGKTSSDAEGRYRLPAPESGTCLVIALAPGHRAGAFRVTSSGRPARQDLALTAATAVRGVVVAAGVPVSGAHLSLVTPEGAVAASARSDSSGRFALTGMKPGDYNLAAAAEGHLPTTRSMTVRNGESTQETVELARAARLSGRAVAEPDGKPVPYARITVRNVRGDVVATTVADGAGHYRVSPLTPGRYAVTASGFHAVEHPIRVRHTDRVTLDVLLRHGNCTRTEAHRPDRPSS